MLTLFPSGHCDLEPRQAWVPQMDCLGLMELGRMHQPTKPPLGPEMPIPLCMDPQPPDASGSFWSKCKPIAPKGQWSLQAKRFEKSPGLHVLWAGFPPPACFFGSPHLQMTAASAECFGRTGICPGDRGKEEGMRHNPWVFLLAHSTLVDNPGTGLSLRFWLLLYTWTSPDGQYQNQIDYNFCSQNWRSSIQSAKTWQKADCGSDHELLIARQTKNEESIENHKWNSSPFRFAQVHFTLSQPKKPTCPKALIDPRNQRWAWKSAAACGRFL